MIPNKLYVVYSDELCYLILLSVGVIDSVANNRWRDYWLLWTIVGVMGLYLIYSNTFVHFNSLGATVSDAIIEMKSYVAFAVVLAASPSFTASEKKLIKWISVANVVIATAVMLSGNAVVKIVMQHPYVGGTTIFISAMIYLMMSLDNKGEVDRVNLTIVVVMLVCGLLCGRSKYFGELVLALYFLLIYRPGFMKKLTLSHIVVIVSVLILVLMVSWQKFDYYFISGNAEATRFDPEVVESFARPVLYFTGGLILIDYFPFGTGLASFASHASIEPYSGVYYEYGIDKVYGLSESMPDFICDAYYPLLAQFGFLGLALFIMFWIYVFSFLKIMIKDNARIYKYQYVIGVNIIIFLLIESIGGLTLAQGAGVASVMALGYVCSTGLRIKEKQKAEKGRLQIETKRYL